MRELAVWMNGERVGVWSRGRSGLHRFTYDASWLESEHVRALSLSLPIPVGREVAGDAVLHYFDNLLPESERIRTRLSARFRTGSTEALDLLQAVGRDCAGAVQLLPIGQRPDGFDRLDCLVLKEAEVERIVEGVTDPAFRLTDGDDDSLRISIAGAQEKTALVRVGKSWCRPLHSTPTTHILKLPLGLVGGRRLDLSHSVENEWLCAQILREFGLPVAHTEIAHFGAQKVLVVERFDRRWMDNGAWIARLPQEDFCQALGVGFENKYESDGGPGIAQCLQVLAGSEAAPGDGRLFLCAQLAFWLLAATDGHAKNFSLFLLNNDRYRLTPLY
ncbi:MAG: HipA domain-containing protein, partial [Burkholderiaceae bacterium]